MAEKTDQLSAEDVALMLKRAGVTVPPDQLEQCRAVVAKLEGSARRLKANLQRNDEPAHVFTRRRTRHGG